MNKLSVAGALLVASKDVLYYGTPALSSLTALGTKFSRSVSALTSAIVLNDVWHGSMKSSRAFGQAADFKAVTDICLSGRMALTSL
jgi:hypothetical protein